MEYFSCWYEFEREILLYEMQDIYIFLIFRSVGIHKVSKRKRTKLTAGLGEGWITAALLLYQALVSYASLCCKSWGIDFCKLFFFIAFLSGIITAI